MRRRLLSAALGLAPLVVLALTSLGAPPARGAQPRTAAPVCASATAWSISLGNIGYYFVDTGGGWVASYAIDGANPFATVSLSVSEHSFAASDVYNGGNTGYTASFSGTLDANCAVTSSDPGHWTSNHDPAGGAFTTSPIGLARKCSANAGRQAQAAQACCPAPALTATARLSRDDREVIATLKAHGLGSEARCGRAELSADHQRIGTVRQTGSTATATARLTGSRSCISKLAATVTQSGESASHETAVSGGSPTFQLARATRTSTGAIQLLVKVDGLRPADVCGRPEITATVAHARRGVVPLTLLPGSAAAVTAHATLSGREECGTLLQIRVKQDQVDDQIAAPPVSGPAPSSCPVSP